MHDGTGPIAVRQDDALFTLLQRLAEAQERSAAALERMASASDRKREKASRDGLERQALAALMESMPTPNVSAIADTIGVSSKTLRRMPKFAAALKQARTISAQHAPRRGHRTADGGVEAYDEGDE